MTHSTSALSAEPNLTPILDMVFQLITFFMLVLSFKTASVDPNVRLPVLGSAQPSYPEAERNFVVLNIDASGELRVYGTKYDLEQYLTYEVENLKKNALETKALKPDEPFQAAAVIRADRGTSYSHLHRILGVCKMHGFRDITLKVMDADATSQVAQAELKASTTKR